MPCVMSGLLNLVESLQKGLTNPDGPSQRDAFTELNDGFQLLPLKCFTEKEVFYVVDFYVSRFILSEPGLTSVILKGLLWFANQQLLNAECAVKICSDGLFSSLHIPSLCKYERRIACRLFLALLSYECTRSGLISMKLEFVRGFIVSVEGEKDPECLMLIFTMHPLVLQHFDRAHLAEEHFDCMAAYFPVDYTPPPGSVSEISRGQLAEKLRACLWAARSLDGSLLLPLLLEKATSYRPEARSDALTLLADCLVGVPQAVSFLSEFTIPLSLQRNPIPIAHVTAYLFALCNMVRQMTVDLDMSDIDDVNQVLCIVAGLATMHSGKSEEMNFVETLLRCLWPEGRSEETANKLDGWFAVFPVGVHMMQMAPQDLVADCLLTAVLAAPDGPLLSRLFRRLAKLFLWPKVDPLPSDACFYRSKFEQIISWTPQISFLNRLLMYFSRCKNLSLQDLHMNEEKVRAVVFNLLHTLQRSCCDLQMCDDGNQSTELESFGLLCRMLSLLKDDNKEVIRAFLAFCPHIFGHLVSIKEATTPLHTRGLEQLWLLAKLVSGVSLVEDDLILYLFKLLQDDPSVELQDVAVEILQRAACDSSTIRNNLLTLLFQHCSDSISLTPVFRLTSSILFITKSLRKSDEENSLPSLASFLQARASDVLYVVERLTDNVAIEKARFCLMDLLSSMRLIVSSLFETHQMKTFTCFMELTKTIEPANPCVAILLECAIISALRPTIPDVPLGKIADLLFKYCTHLSFNHHSIDSTLWVVAFNELCVCSATLINKFPDDVVAETFSRVLCLLLEVKSEAHSGVSLALASSRFVVLTLRGLIVSQLIATTAARKLLMDSLLGVLLANDSSHSLVTIQRSLLFQTLHLLLPLHAASNSGIELETEEGIEPSPLDEEATHCLVNPLAMQKCFCLVGLRLRAAWQQMTALADPTTEQASLEEAFLHGYLRLASLLPDGIFGHYISGILEAAVLAAADGSRHSISPQTQSLGLFVIARLASPRSTLSTSSSLPLISSFVDAGDFLDKLSHFRLTCASFMNTSRLRFNLARCLRFLVDLPPIITARHRGGVRRLLEELLDDDCQSVRLEAARAHNEWCLKV